MPQQYLIDTPTSVGSIKLLQKVQLVDSGKPAVLLATLKISSMYFSGFVKAVIKKVKHHSVLLPE